jgi:hypothetical protein
MTQQKITLTLIPYAHDAVHAQLYAHQLLYSTNALGEVQNNIKVKKGDDIYEFIHPVELTGVNDYPMIIKNGLINIGPLHMYPDNFEFLDGFQGDDFAYSNGDSCSSIKLNDLFKIHDPYTKTITYNHPGGQGYPSQTITTQVNYTHKYYRLKSWFNYVPNGENMSTVVYNNTWDIVEGQFWSKVPDYYEVVFTPEPELKITSTARNGVQDACINLVHAFNNLKNSSDIARFIFNQTTFEMLSDGTDGKLVYKGEESASI